MGKVPFGGAGVGVRLDRRVGVAERLGKRVRQAAGRGQSRCQSVV